MKKAQLISEIDDILREYQFQRAESLWNRVYEEVVDVIDLQISRAKDAFTINSGVADKYIIRACWGMDGSGMVDEPSCTVRVRLGELLHGRDVWWDLSDGDGMEEALSGIQDAAIPFLQSNHSIDQMIETLEADPASRRYPPGIIYLALLHFRKGETEICREMLKSMKLTGAWSQRAPDILVALN